MLQEKEEGGIEREMWVPGRELMLSSLKASIFTYGAILQTLHSFINYSFSSQSFPSLLFLLCFTVISYTVLNCFNPIIKPSFLGPHARTLF